MMNEIKRQNEVKSSANPEKPTSNITESQADEILERRLENNQPKNEKLEANQQYIKDGEKVKTDDVGQPIKNKQEGLRREEEVESDLKKKYPEKEGYTILPETYLRDKDGKIVKDEKTNEARRIDFVVVDAKGKVCDMIEVTSKTADKTGQMFKENRIRQAGGNYINYKGQTIKIPDNVKTRIERRD